MHGQLRCRPRLFGGKLHRQLRLRKKKIIFFDDVYDKTQSKFMNKSTSMESKERDRENRRRRSNVRRQRERLRALANRRNKSDEQREKEQERAPKKNPC